jgi:endonuclease G
MEGVMVLPRQLIEQTRERYQARTAQREIHVEKIKSGSPLEADSPERVQKRMNRIAGAEASRPAPAASAAMALERIMGRSDLMSVNYLEMGLQAARCVGRITIRTRTGQTLGYGSGFTVAPRLLITNNHVLDAAEAAAASRVEFNYQEDARGNLLRSVVLNIEPDVFFLTDKRLDFTMVAVSERSVDGAELGGFVWLPLIEEQGKVIVGEYVNIIQHPNGEPKQLALRENQLLDLLL